VPDNIVDRLARGVALEDGPAKFEKIERINASGSHSWFQVMLTEGRNREVRRLWESQGYQVSRLKRVRYGDVTLPRLLKRGNCVEMEAEQVEKLRQHFGLEHADPVLTLQPVIGQRRSRPVEIRVGKEHAKESFVNGHVNEEARELRPLRPRARRAPARSRSSWFRRPARRQAGRKGPPGPAVAAVPVAARATTISATASTARRRAPMATAIGPSCRVARRPASVPSTIARVRRASATSAARAAPRVVPAAPALPASPRVAVARAARRTARDRATAMVTAAIRPSSAAGTCPKAWKPVPRSRRRADSATARPSPTSSRAAPVVPMARTARAPTVRTSRRATAAHAVPVARAAIAVPRIARRAAPGAIADRTRMRVARADPAARAATSRPSASVRTVCPPTIES
jgi:hypothetical protein